MDTILSIDRDDELTDNRLVGEIMRNDYHEEAEIVSVREGLQSRVWQLRIGQQLYGLRRTYVKSPSRFEDMVQVVLFLRANDVPTYAPVHTKDGSTIAISDSSIFMLYRWIDGIDLIDQELDEEDAIELGRWLGVVHKVLSAFPMSADLMHRRYKSCQQVISKLHSIIHHLDADPGITGGEAHLREMLMEHIGILQQWAKTESDISAIFDETQIVHGDYQRGNIIYDRPLKQLSGLVDLESFHYAPRIFDVGRACSFLFESNPSLTHAFVQGYNRENLLTRHEMACYVLLLQDYHVKNIWAYEQYVYHGNRRVDLFRMLKVFHEVESHRQSIEAAVCSVI